MNAKHQSAWTVALLIVVAGLTSHARAQGRKLYVADYRDKMEGAWIGQSVGVAYGAPTEFAYGGTIMPNAKVKQMPVWKPEMINGTFGQDDLYVEMTFMRTLETRGIDVSTRLAGIDFANSRYRLWCANANARNNLRKGIAAPWSSDPRYHPSTDDIDYQIEADFSGILSPGMPTRVIRLGGQFGLIMNRGDGLFAGQFIGGMYAEAYFETNRIKVVEGGLKCIPANSQYAEMVRDMLKWHEADPVNWSNAWHLAVAKYQSSNYVGRVTWKEIDCKINGAMVLLGFLWGDGDIDRTMYISTAGGFDSDCNPSSALGVLGTMLGAKAFGEKYVGKLDRTRKWEFTDYTYPGLLAASEKLTRQLVVAEGGSIATDETGEYFLIADPERYSEAETASILYLPGAFGSASKPKPASVK